MPLFSEYPDFRPLELADVDALRPFVASFPCYSDFNLASLFTWNDNNSSSYCFLHGNLVIKIADYNTKEDSYSLLGTKNIDATIKSLLASSAITALERIPDTVIERLMNPLAFVIEPQRDEDDYVYELASLTRLEGPEYRKFRRSLSNFISKNDFADTVQLEKVDPDRPLDQTPFLDLAKRWRLIRGRDDEDAALEYNAIERALRWRAALQLTTWALWHNTQLLGFIITENVNDTTVLHFEKADTEVPGVASYLEHSVFAALHAEKQSFLNYEQDLGIPGLREKKLSLHPSHFMQKYKISAPSD